MGIAGKVRPCLLLTEYPADDELALVTVIPHTTALRGSLGGLRSQTVPPSWSLSPPTDSNRVARPLATPIGHIGQKGNGDHRDCSR